MNNNICSKLCDHTKYISTFLWGIIEFEYDRYMLSSGIIKITKLSFINQKHEIIHFNDNDISSNVDMFTIDLNKLNFDNIQEGEFIYLCCKDKDNSRYDESSQFKTIYSKTYDGLEPIQYIANKRKIHITSKKDIVSSSMYFAIMSIKKSKNIWSIQEYEPSSVYIKKESTIYKKVISIIDKSSSICDTLHTKISSDSNENIFDRTTMLNKNLYLVLSQHTCSLRNIMSYMHVNPCNLYSFLSNMLVSIESALSNKISWPSLYNHHNMSSSINYICSSIINLIENSLKSDVCIVPLNMINSCNYEIILNDSMITDNNIYIQVHSSIMQDQQTIKSEICGLTIASSSIIDNVINLRISGIERKVFWGSRNIKGIKVAEIENSFYVSLNCNSQYFDNNSNIIISGSDAILSKYNLYIIENKNTKQ